MEAEAKNSFQVRFEPEEIQNGPLRTSNMSHRRRSDFMSTLPDRRRGSCSAHRSRAASYARRKEERSKEGKRGEGKADEMSESKADAATDDEGKGGAGDTDDTPASTPVARSGRLGRRTSTLSQLALDRARSGSLSVSQRAARRPSTAPALDASTKRMSYSQPSFSAAAGMGGGGGGRLGTRKSSTLSTLTQERARSGSRTVRERLGERIDGRGGGRRPSTAQGGLRGDAIREEGGGVPHYLQTTKASRAAHFTDEHRMTWSSAEGEHQAGEGAVRSSRAGRGFSMTDGGRRRSVLDDQGDRRNAGFKRSVDWSVTVTVS